MPPGDPIGSADRRLAADWLRLEPGDTRALLERLAEVDFFPDPLTHAAIRAAFGRPPGPGMIEELDRLRRDRFDRDLARFRLAFFDTPPPERRARWEALSEAGRGLVGPDGQLRHLDAGLDAEIPPAGASPGPDVRLAGWVGQVFASPPDVRAAEARTLAREIRADPSIQPAALDRAVRQLRKRHRLVAGLAPNFLAKLVRSRSPVKLRKAWSLPGLSIDSGTSAKPIHLLWLGILLASALLRMAGTLRQPGADGPAAPPAPIAAPRPSEAFLRGYRDRFREPIRAELARLHRSIADPALREVVGVLPLDDLPPNAEHDPLSLASYWTDPVRARHAAALRSGLARAGIVLDGSEFDQLARGCLPGPIRMPVPLREPGGPRPAGGGPR